MRLIPPALLLAGLLCGCASPAAELELLYWYPSLNMEAEAAGNGEGTRVDFEDDLGISDQGYPGGRLKWFTGGYGWILAEYMGTDYSERATLDRTIYWKGRKFKAGTPVETELAMSFGRLSWLWPFLSVGNGDLRVGSIVEARTLDVETDIKAYKKFKTHEDTLEIREILPALGVVFDLRPREMINMVLQASGFYGGRSGYLYDVEAALKILPTRHVAVTTGYRLLRFGFEEDSDEVEARLDGLFLAASVRF